MLIQHLILDGFDLGVALVCRFEKQQADDELTKLENDQRLKAMDAENEKHRPAGATADPMAELEIAVNA